MIPMTNSSDATQNHVFTSHLCSDADLYAEDCNSVTPVLAAAVHGKTDAFCCLMMYVDMSDRKQNPLFKAIEINCTKEIKLNVSFEHQLKCVP